VHDLLRLYAGELAAEEMTESDQHAAIRRVITWYLYAAAAAVRVIAPGRREVPLPPGGLPMPSFPDRQRATAWCERNRANLVAATEQALRMGELELAWRLPAALWGFYQVRSHRADHAETHRLALIAAEQLGDPFARGWIHTNLGILEQDLLHYQPAIEHLKRALDLRSSIGDERGRAQTLGALGTAYWQSGLLDEARHCYERSLRIERETGDRHGEATSLSNLGGIDHLQGHYERAIENYRTALAISKEIGNRWGEGYPLSNIGESLHELGRFREAIEHFQAALAIRREVGDRFGEALTLRMLAETLHVTGQREAAQDAVHTAVALLEELNDPTAEDARVQLSQLTAETPAQHRMRD
jgi:tetratricopeptide (TPR) repeat protein